jgi:hypothetical protein
MGSRPPPLGAGDAENEGVALAAAAECGGADRPAAPARFQGDGEGEPGAAHADGMAEGDGAAIDVDPVR